MVSIAIPIESSSSISRKLAGGTEAQRATVADALVAKIANHAGADNRTLVGRLREQISLMDWTDVDNTGVASVNAQLQEASNVGNSLVIPAGTYRITSNITINVPVEFLAGAKFILNAGVVLTCNCEIYADKYQQIFDCPTSARVKLRQAHSICWYGANPVGNTIFDSAPAIQKAIWNAIEADVDGYQQGQGGHVFLPYGYYDCLTPIIYYGGSGLGLVFYGEVDTGIWAGGNNGSVLRWYGTAPVFFTLSGANFTTIRDIVIVSEAGTTVERILWINAKNGDPGADPIRDRPSTGVILENVLIAIGGIGGDCTDACNLISVGHNILPGGSSSQVDTITLRSVYMLGRGGNGVGQQTGGGVGFQLYGGGNAKVFNFDKIVTNGLHTGLKGPFSGYVLIRDWGGGNQQGYDLEQDGAGSIIILGMNSEGSNGLLKQTGGETATNCSINACEWYGWPPPIVAGSIPPRRHGVVTVRGYVELSGVTLGLNNAATLEADSTPWIELQNPTHELDPITKVPYPSSASLHLRGVNFNKAYSDGAFLYAPIIDGSGNPLYQAAGYLTEKRQRVFVDGCTSLESWGGAQGAVTPIMEKPNGAAHLTEALKADLAFSRINHNSLVTITGNTSVRDGFRTYLYDAQSSATVDGDLVENGPGVTPVGRYHALIPTSFLVGAYDGSVKYTKIDVLGIGNCPALAIGGGTPRADASGPIANILGSTTGGVFVNIDPTSIPDGFTVLNVDLPAMVSGYPITQQGSCSDLLVGQLWNYHATGATQQYVRSTAGDCSTRYGSATKDVSAGLDHSANSWVVSNHYLLGTNNLLSVELTTKVATVYGPIESVTNADLELNPKGTGRLKIGTAAIAGAGVSSTHKLEIKDSAGISYYILLELK